MDRFPIESAADLAGNHARHMARIWEEDIDITRSLGLNECQNCGASVDHELHLVPEFEYMGCDDCMEEAMRVIAREKAAKRIGRGRELLALSGAKRNAISARLVELRCELEGASGNQEWHWEMEGAIEAVEELLKQRDEMVSALDAQFPVSAQLGRDAELSIAKKQPGRVVLGDVQEVA